jgi:hypothetical protein
LSIGGSLRHLRHHFGRSWASASQNTQTLSQEHNDQGRRELPAVTTAAVTTAAPCVVKIACVTPKHNNVPEEGCVAPTPLTTFTDVFTVTESCGLTINFEVPSTTSTGSICDKAPFLNGKLTYTASWVKNGNKKTFTCTDPFKIKDNTKPKLTFDGSTEDKTVDCMSNIPSAPTYTATDECASPTSPVKVTFTTVNSKPEDVTCATPYTRTYKWVAEDNCGQKTIVKQVITVKYTLPPTFTLPTSTTRSLGCKAEVETTEDAKKALATATEKCYDSVVAPITGVFDNDPVGCLNDYTFTRTWTATNTCGITNTFAQAIHVFTDGPPTLAGIPVAASVVCDTNVPAAPIPNTDVTATDVCGNTLNVEYTSEGTRSGCSGVYTRTWKAVDACSRATTATQTITVTDEGPTIVNPPADDSFGCAGDDLDAFDASVNAVKYTDTCDGDIDATVTSNDVKTTDIAGCTNKFTRTYTLSATDSCSNTAADTTITATVDDTTPPTLKTCDGGPGQLANFDLCAGGTYPTGYTGYTTHDTCDGDKTVTTMGDPVCCSPDNVHVAKTWTFDVTDNCGNSAPVECYQVITNVAASCT